MDDSLYESFRWLDDDRDLDLSLSEYQTCITNSSLQLSHRWKPSFRRTLSLNSANLRKAPFQRTTSFSSTNPARKSTQFSLHERAPVRCEPQEKPHSMENIASSCSSSSRPSSNGQFYHASRSSTSSIDPCAQYYQDPEARLKLRVYLASPQKFDEAVEFGFPTLTHQEIPTIPTAGKGASILNQQTQRFAGTFLHDDDVSVLGENPGTYVNVSRLSYIVEDPRSLQDIVAFDNERQFETPLSNPVARQHQSIREMTLRMTLTRLDLRNDSPDTPPSVENSLTFTEAPPMHRNSHFEELDMDGRGLIKKIWHKFCKRND